jgi:hypothetical protein
MRVEMAAMKRDAEHYSRQVSCANDLKEFYEVEMFLCLKKILLLI